MFRQYMVRVRRLYGVRVTLVAETVCVGAHLAHWATMHCPRLAEALVAYFGLLSNALSHAYKLTDKERALVSEIIAAAPSIGLQVAPSKTTEN